MAARQLPVLRRLRPVLVLLVVLLVALREVHGSVVLQVDCLGTGPLRSLHAARDAVREHLASAGARGEQPAPVQVHVSGPCHLAEPLTFDARDSGPVEWRPLEPQTHFVVSGGQPILWYWLEPVQDPDILAQIPEVARPFVRQLDLQAHGIDPGPAPISGRRCRTYAEGMPGGAINSPVGLEFFSIEEDGDVSPLTLARWPNAPWQPANWSHVLHSTQSGPNNRTFGPDPVTLARAAGWKQQFTEDPASIYVHQYNRVGWADMHWALEGLTSTNMTFGNCGNMSVGETFIETGNYFYTYNLLSELDEEGEYYVNRTSKMLYAWLGPPGAGPDVAGYVSLLEAPLLDLANVSGTLWRQASLRYGRGVGFSCRDCTNVTLLDSEISGVGTIAVNISAGSGVLLSNLSVSAAGAGGVYLYAGDRATLQPSAHVLENSRITAFNRWQHCYAPGVLLGGVGQRVSGCSIWDGPHQAIFLSGNEHVISGCNISLVTRITEDSGAFYMGRDLTYRGNVLENNNWFDLTSGNPVLYADDCASSITVIGNTFRNCTGGAAALEGGKGHVFINNYIGQDAKGVHAVGKSCTSSLQYLSLVPWNTSAVWLERYPTLLLEVQQSSLPWHLEFRNNTICTPSANVSNFVDMSASEVAKYNGSDDGGQLGCRGPAPPWTGGPVRGWNSWTAYGCGVSDADIRATAEALVARGLARAGYTIVAIDDCWASQRDANGTIQPDPHSFPYGIAALADYVRSLGLSFGLYTAIGNKTCAGRPGSAGFEAIDAATYASWGVTWLKLDNCDYPKFAKRQIHASPALIMPCWDPALLYDAWAEAFDRQAYRIPMASKAVINYTTAVQVAASRRVGGDVSASWQSLLSLAYMAEPLFAQARAGNQAIGLTSFWTDIELVQVGRGSLSANESAAHFWLWAAMHAPLVLSSQISELSDAEIELLTNPEVLAVNSDPLGAQARRVALQPVAEPVLPLSPVALGCSVPEMVAPGQAWALVEDASGIGFRVILASGPAAGLCLMRPSCSNGSSLAVDVCPPPGSGCEDGLGTLWRWTNGTDPGTLLLQSLARDHACLNMEPRLSTMACKGSEPYQQLSFLPATGQLAMNFTGSGARADYTGYPQCVDALPLTHAEVWAAPLENGDLSVLLFNPTATETATITANITAIAAALLTGRSAVTELSQVRDIGARVTVQPVPAAADFAASCAPHSARFFRITPK